MIFFRQFQHLLPNGRAWSLTIDKALRRFMVGLSDVSRQSRDFVDRVYLDLFPNTTRALESWERQFNLPDSGLTEQQRRTRLTATWRALGGQSAQYIQGILRDSGFDVYVHEWFNDDGTVRNPALYLNSDGDSIRYTAELGEAAAEMGEPGIELGERRTPVGYLLVNRILDNDGAPVPYQIPTDQNQWRYILYIGAENFGDDATIDPKRRDEFEELLLKLKPAQQWIGVIVKFGVPGETESVA